MTRTRPTPSCKNSTIDFLTLASSRFARYWDVVASSDCFSLGLNFCLAAALLVNHFLAGFADWLAANHRQDTQFGGLLDLLADHLVDVRSLPVDWARSKPQCRLLALGHA
jgi:phosphatidylglycerophosphate synthase